LFWFKIYSTRRSRIYAFQSENIKKKRGGRKKEKACDSDINTKRGGENIE
jgi:hypothetical protein